MLRKLIKASKRAQFYSPPKTYQTLRPQIRQALDREGTKLQQQGYIKTGEYVPPVKTVREKNRMRFIHWLKTYNPALYRKAIVRNRNSQLNGFGDFFTSVTDTIKNLAPTYIQTRAQRDLLRMQMERARAGMPPLNPIDYAPAVRIETQVAPETRQAIQQTGKDIALPIALTVGGVMLLMFMKPRGKR